MESCWRSQCMATLGILDAQKYPSLPDLHTRAPVSGRPASCSLYPIATPGGVKSSGGDKNGVFQSRKFQVSL